MSSTRLAEKRPNPYYHRVLGIIKWKIRACQCRNRKKEVTGEVNFGRRVQADRWANSEGGIAPSDLSNQEPFLERAAVIPMVKVEKLIT